MFAEVVSFRGHVPSLIGSLVGARRKHQLYAFPRAIEHRKYIGISTNSQVGGIFYPELSLSLCTSRCAW